MKKQFRYMRIGYINDDIVSNEIVTGEWFNELDFLHSLTRWNYEDTQLGHVKWLYGPI